MAPLTAPSSPRYRLTMLKILYRLQDCEHDYERGEDAEKWGGKKETEVLSSTRVWIYS